jgi:hypothetical protein
MHNPRTIAVWSGIVASSLAVYWASAAFFLVGAICAEEWISPCTEHHAIDSSPIGRLTAWDGQWYALIARTGYTYDPERKSSVAFYPAYPLTARAVSDLTGMSVEVALLAVSHFSLMGAMVVFAAYAQLRVGGVHNGTHAAVLSRPAMLSLSALAFFPTTFYFRVALSESLFLLLVVLVLYGLERNWPLVLVALLVGMATATKLVGIALIVPLVIRTCAGTESRHIAVFRCIAVFPITIWGILAYGAFLASTFDAPFAFVETQQHWNRRQLPHNALDTFASIVTFEPLRSVYDSESPCHWSQSPPRHSAWLNMMFANPIYWLVSATLLIVGAWRRWLNGTELLVGALLLLIPFMLQGYRTCMASQARFASVVLPIYLVLGQVLSRIPLWLSATVLVVSNLKCN